MNKWISKDTNSSAIPKGLVGDGGNFVSTFSLLPSLYKATFSTHGVKRHGQGNEVILCLLALEF